MTLLIADVSEHNGWIDWEKVKESGNHVIIRMGYGQDYESQDDKKWARNITECERLGIPHGAYLYSYASTEGQALGEADHALRLIKGRTFQYPVYYDLEEARAQDSAKDIARAFCNKLEDEGFFVGVYANMNWWQNYLNGLYDYTRWVASWGVNDVQIACDLWQYTNKGVFPGVPGTVEGGVDLNRSYRNFVPELNKFYGATASGGLGSIDSIARDVLKGMYGNGEERRHKLGTLYDEVQARVNELVIEQMAHDVIKGKYGNGDARRKKLGAMYDKVQARVNQIIGG